MSLLVLYAPLDWSFFSIQFFALNLDNGLGVLTKKKFFVWYSMIIYTNFNSSLICCLFSGYIYIYICIYIYIGISTAFSFVFECNAFEEFCDDFYERHVILSAIVLPIKSLVASSVFLNCSFCCSF